MAQRPRRRPDQGHHGNRPAKAPPAEPGWQSARIRPAPLGRPRKVSGGRKVRDRQQPRRERHAPRQTRCEELALPGIEGRRASGCGDLHHRGKLQEAWRTGGSLPARPPHPPPGNSRRGNHRQPHPGARRRSPLPQIRCRLR